MSTHGLVVHVYGHCRSRRLRGVKHQATLWPVDQIANDALRGAQRTIGANHAADRLVKRVDGHGGTGSRSLQVEVRLSTMSRAK